MSTDVTLPALGESVTEGTVTRWLKSVGDTVAVDEPLLEVSTDKVDTEIPSPVAGTLLEILVDEDATVEVGTVLARLGDASEQGSAPEAPEQASAPTPEVAAAAEAPAEPAPAPEPQQQAAPAPEAPAAPAAPPAAPVGASPATPAPSAEAPAEPAANESAPAPSGDSTDITLPALGESVTEGTVTRWLKAVGDAIAVDEPILEVSTDKVDTEIPSPVAGTLLEILVGEDETVEVGTVLAKVGSGAPAPTAPSAPAQETAAPAAPAAAPAAPTAPEPPAAPAEPAVQAAPAAPEAPAPQQAPAVDTGATVGGTSGYVTPIVRKLAAERGVNLAGVEGTGVGGRIRKEDVLAAPVASAQQVPEPEVAPAATTQAPAASSGEQKPSLRGTSVKMTRIRKITAERMLESLHGMAQLTTVVEVDCSAIWGLRAKSKSAFEAKHGAKLTFLPFFTKAVADALVEHPNLNASVDGDSIVYHGEVNLSLAVDTEKGLMLPTLRNAEDKSIAAHAQQIADLAGRARSGGLKADEISGGTFSVTNTGSGGTLLDTPIVPSPQVGILATTIIEKRVVVSKGTNGEDVLSIKPMCYLPLSYDHRIVDGADAARFLQTVKGLIEAGDFESSLEL
jgi:2-oxoglutarate dehydrogenase E2 component (dihydrolipoamide succinyltransferase)